VSTEPPSPSSQLWELCLEEAATALHLGFIWGFTEVPQQGHTRAVSSGHKHWPSKDAILPSFGFRQPEKDPASYKRLVPLIQL